MTDHAKDGEITAQDVLYDCEESTRKELQSLHLTPHIPYKTYKGAYKRLSAERLDKILGSLLQANVGHLEELIERSNAPAIHRWLAKAILAGMENNDFEVLDKLLDRIVGKPVATKKIFKSQKNTIVLDRVEKLSDEALTERLNLLRHKLDNIPKEPSE